MRHVPIAELKDKMSEIIAAAQAGEDITITRHGRDVARIIGMEGERIARQHDALSGLKDLRDRLREQGVRIAADEWIAWKAEGRR